MIGLGCSLMELVEGESRGDLCRMCCGDSFGSIRNMVAVVAALLVAIVVASCNAGVSCDTEKCCKQQNQKCTVRCQNLTGYEKSNCQKNCGLTYWDCAKVVTVKQQMR